ncbi:hypothetical protein AXF42_Ash014016 [Apostasia shenzhenica]|uniref:Uncharacterized protein n=1 Tax=Apostasia shenzhenica TaxID=1088818 RepID=A0A2I0A944_9ASPA|nr:hypothetical protein AXF42_Ash014016 [Apostasia shenzhenica]
MVGPSTRSIGGREAVLCSGDRTSADKESLRGSPQSPGPPGGGHGSIARHRTTKG